MLAYPRTAAAWECWPVSWTARPCFTILALGKRLAAHLLELVIPQQSTTTLKADAAEATPDFDDGDEQLRRGVTMS